MRALIVRAHQLGAISPRQYTYLFQQLTKLGYRKRGPENLDIQSARMDKAKPKCLMRFPIIVNAKSGLSPEQAKAYEEKLKWGVEALWA